MSTRSSQNASVRAALRKYEPDLADRWEPGLSLEKALELHRRQRINAVAPKIEGRPVGGFCAFVSELPLSAQNQQNLDWYQAHRDKLPRVAPQKWLDFFCGPTAVMAVAPGASIASFEASGSVGVSGPSSTADGQDTGDVVFKEKDSVRSVAVKHDNAMGIKQKDGVEIKQKLDDEDFAGGFVHQRRSHCGRCKSACK